MIFTILLVIALLCFLLAVPGQYFPRINLVALGLALIVLALLLQDHLNY